MTYFCDKTWDIRATLNPTKYAQAKAKEGQAQEDVDEFAARWVDPITCKLNNTDQPIDQRSIDEMTKLNMTHEEYYKYLREDGNWSPIMFILFSMKVATGFIAGYTPSTFYAVLVYGLSATVRISFLFSTW